MPSSTSCHTDFGAVLKDTVHFLCCEFTLPAHIQFNIHQCLKGLLHRSALNVLIILTLSMLGISLRQVQNSFVLVKLHEVCTDPPHQFFKVPLGKFAALHPLFMFLIMIKKIQSQYQLLRNATWYGSPLGYWADSNPLTVTMQLIPYSLRSSLIKPLSLQFRDKDAVCNSMLAVAVFGFVLKTTLITQGCFLFLLSRACIASRIFRFSPQK